MGARVKSEMTDERRVCVAIFVIEQISSPS